MKARDLMTKEVVTVSPATGVRHAARIMLVRGVSGLPVMDDDAVLVGIVTEGDLLRRAELGGGAFVEAEMSGDQRARAYVRAHSWNVGEVMSAGVVTIDEGTTIKRVAALMIEHGVKRLPVTREGALVGIVSRVDLLRVVATAGLDDTAPGDQAIRRAVLTRLREDVGLDGAGISVTVSGGMVHLWGNAVSEAEIDAVRVVAENVRGTRGVVVHIGVLPSSGSESEIPKSGLIARKRDRSK